jgi:putative transposase
MIDRDHELPVKRQAELVGISRGSVYYHPEPVSEAELALMRRIDELHLEHPFAGSRMLRDFLRLQGIEVGRRHVGTLMRRMGIQALYRKPNTSKKHPAHPVFPYALRNLAIERANQVWALDITYIPMARGWVYLVAVLDWASRRVLAHRVSITMEADFCVEALREAAARWGAPEIVNTDQGSQFSSAEFVAAVKSLRRAAEHGRQRLLARQRVRRAAVAQREVRGRVPQGLRQRQRRKAEPGRVLRVLQRAPAAPEPRRAHTGHGLLRIAAADEGCSVMG